MQKTTIPWATHSWNPTSGCSGPNGAPCPYCYARAMAHRFKRSFEPTCHPEKLDEPLRMQRPARVFVDSNGDLFDPAIPASFIGQVFNSIGASPWHTHIILTKQARRMAEVVGGFYSAQSGFTLPSFRPLSNLWLGVTAESQREADERIPLLLQTPAEVRFCSVEPLLGPVDLTAIDYDNILAAFAWKGRLDWVIVGSDSTPGAKLPDPAWVDSILSQCKAAGVPAFCKGSISGPQELPLAALPF